MTDTVLDRFALDRTPRHLADITDRQWDYQLGLNLRAVFTGARTAARIVDDGGSIINISSTAALKASPNNGPYAVAKADADLPQLAAKLGVPLGRLRTPEDVGNAVAFLASPASSWITGHTLVVNGGSR